MCGPTGLISNQTKLLRAKQILWQLQPKSFRMATHLDGVISQGQRHLRSLGAGRKIVILKNSQVIAACFSQLVHLLKINLYRPGRWKVEKCFGKHGFVGELWKLIVRVYLQTQKGSVAREASKIKKKHAVGTGDVHQALTSKTPSKKNNKIILNIKNDQQKFAENHDLQAVVNEGPPQYDDTNPCHPVGKPVQPTMRGMLLNLFLDVPPSVSMSNIIRVTSTCYTHQPSSRVVVTRRRCSTKGTTVQWHNLLQDPCHLPALVSKSFSWHSWKTGTG